MSTGEKSVARIIGKLREAGVELFKGKKNIEVCKKLWVTEQIPATVLRGLDQSQVFTYTTNL